MKKRKKILKLIDNHISAAELRCKMSESQIESIYSEAVLLKLHDLKKEVNKVLKNG